MCSAISWHQFLLTVFFLLLAYYLVVVFLKYRSEIMAWATMKINPSHAPGHYVYSTGATSNGKSPGSQNAVRELTHDLQIVFDAASGKKTRKPDLLRQIRKTLQDHKQLKGTNLEGEILQHIAAQAKESCSVHINPGELNDLWNP